MTDQHRINQQQYTDKAQAYLHSSVHAQGAEFAKMQALIGGLQLQNILDLGCGGGHVSYQIAPLAERVTAYDLTESMLATVAQEAARLGLDNITTQQGAAEILPFADGSFDGIISRYSAHHWQDVGAAMREIHRVLHRDGRVMFVDTLGSSQPIYDTFFQSIEKIRDPSHVRDYSLAEWCAFAEDVGFTVEIVEKQHLDLNFQSWTERMQTPPHAVETLRYLQQHAADSVKRHYRIQDDGSFSSEVCGWCCVNNEVNSLNA